ncbi:hypothetical protein FDP41_008866 [Naegleria fowleri]|uniref:Uncharacterized protein n=1 Tax=Naegleria fowleri TaxID=5763 RepID=A0A6A5B3B4_NAEFO|nr:uncharacterized protein FDP41_008866 [Naegleria fowleri]KAF0972617.1 hypothetical protein FDP41_008866 [Naegleria fowleri]
MEARSLDISIPFVINSTPLNTFGTNFQSQTYICGTPAVFRDRIKLLWLEQLSGYVREGSQVNGPNSSFGKPIGFWSSNLRCYVDISQQATTLTSSGDSLANQQQQQPKCLYPLGTYFTHCGSNDLLPLLPIRPMFFYLNQIESIRSDAFLLVLQQKKMLRLAIELESIVLSYASVYSKEVLSSKLSLSMMEMRSLQVFFNEIARRLRENILSYLPQFELFYDLDKSSSTSYQLMSITIQNGVEKATQQFENMGSGTNATRYLSPSSGSDQTWSNLYELIHFSLLQEGISEDANMELAMSFSSMAQFVDTQIQIIDELFKLINDTLSLDKVIDLSLYTNSPVYDFIDSHSKVLSLTEVDTFSYLRQFIGLDRNFAQESLSKTPSISIDFSSQIFTMIQTTSYMSKVSFKATPPSSYSLINGYLMGDVSNSKILVTDITKQARVLDLVALSGNSQWMVDSSLETDYKPFLKKIPSVTSTTSTTGTRSIITSASLQSTQRTISTPRRRPLSNSVQSYSSITTNHFKLMSFLHEKRRLQTFAPNRRSLLALTSLPTYNCEKGRYGPQCKICYPGTYSPGDGLLYVCSNGPDGQVEYTESGSTNENCAFRCKDTKKYRSGNQCVNIPVRYYSVDNGATTLSECSKNGNSYGITDPSIQQDLLQIATSGQHAFPSSCKTALRDLLSLTFNQTSMFDTTTLTTNSSFSLSHSFTLSIDFKLTPKEKWNFKLKDYQVAYGIVTVPGEWTWQLIFDSPDSIYMQVKKLNPVKNEPRLLSLSFPYDTEWHNFILQYDEEKHVLSLYRDRAYIGSCLFALSQQQEFRLVIGGFFYFNATHTPSLYSYLPASGISNLRIYQGAIMDDLLLSSMKTSSSQWPLWLNSWCESTPGYALFGGKCIRVSCENDDMIYDSSSQQCICSYGYFSSNVSNVTPSCTACPFMTTTGSFLPRTSMKDCQCMHDYIYSEYYQECVMAQSSLLPPTPNFNFGQSYGPYKELEESILSQHFYPVGEMTITLELNEEDDIELIDPQDPSLNLPQKVYQVKLLANGTQLLWSLQLSKNQLLSFFLHMQSNRRF